MPSRLACRSSVDSAPPNLYSRHHVQERVRTIVLEQADQTDLVLGQLAQHPEERRVDARRGVAIHRRRQQVQVALAQRRAVPHAPRQRLGRERHGRRAPSGAGDRGHPLPQIAQRFGEPRRHLRNVPQGACRQQRHRAEAAAESTPQRQLAPGTQHQIADRARRVPHRLPLFSEDHAARLHDLFQFAHPIRPTGFTVFRSSARAYGRIPSCGIRRLVRRALRRARTVDDLQAREAQAGVARPDLRPQRVDA